MNAGLPSIPGYRIDALIGQGAESLVYRGFRGAEPVAVKVLKHGRDLEDAEQRLRQEGASLARMMHPGVVRVIEVGQSDGPFLAMELVEGKSMRATLKQRGRLPENDVVRIGKEVASALSVVHRRGLVHRDIKPENFILQSSGAVKIIDFGFAHGMRDQKDPTKVVVGTLVYASPEQLGMLNRGVDGRADLYSLGCVLFECLAGRPPFVVTESHELLHMHAAVAAPVLRTLDAKISPAMSSIVAKLLAKDPDDRYQSAAGLLYDLEHIDALRDGTAGNKLVLGSHDGEVRIVPEVPLVGRSLELARCERMWSEAVAGRGGVLQVDGEGGSGKSRLVRELVRFARQGPCLVLKGKAQQGETTPFGAVREAVDSFLDLLEHADESEKPKLRARLAAATKDSAAIVKRLTRKLLRAMPNVPDVVPLDPEQDQVRFLDKVAEMLARLGTEEAPLLIVIDDVQWLDPGSRDVLRRLAQRAPQTHVLVALTARNDDVSRAPVAAFVDSLESDLGARIVLQPFTAKECTDFVTAMMGGRPLEPSLIDQLTRRSGGNPFALGEYARALAEQGLLRPTPTGWVVDGGSISELNLASDVIGLLLSVVEKLSPRTQELLTLAAAIGFTFDQWLLVKVVEDARAVRRALDEAMRASLLEELDLGRYAFVHDRVREALLAHLPQTARVETHQRIADALDAHLEERDSIVFELARHYALGDVERNKQRVFDTSLAAGRAALEAHSSAEAKELLRRARALVPDVMTSQLTRADLEERLASACARTGEHEAAAQHYAAALELAVTNDQRVAIQVGLTALHFAAADYTRAWDAMESGLRLLGARFPRSPVAQFFVVVWIGLTMLVRLKTGWGFGTAMGAERERREKISRLLSSGLLLGWFFDSPLPRITVIMRRVQNAHYLGIHPEFGVALACWALLLGIITSNPKIVAGVLRKADAVHAQTTDREALATGMGLSNTALDYAGDAVGAQRRMRESMQTIERYAAPYDGIVFIVGMLFSSVIAGRARAVLELAERKKALFDDAKSPAFASMRLGAIAAAYGLLGDQREGALFAQEADDITKRIKLGFARRCYLGNNILRLAELEEPGEELEQSVQEFLKLTYEEPYVRHFQIAILYVRLRQALAVEGAERARRIRVLQKQKRAFSMPPIFIGAAPITRAHVRVIESSLLRIAGKLEEAQRHIETARVDAETADSPWARFEVHRESARIYAALSKPARAQGEIRAAWTIAHAEGWAPRRRSLQREHGLIGDDEGSLDTQRFASSMSRTLGERRASDALLEVSLATSSSSDPKEQAQAALAALLKLLGSDRAVLFTVDEQGKLRLEAGRESGGNPITELFGFSSTVARRAAETREAQIVAGTAEAEAVGSESAVSNELRSIIAVPLTLRERFVGVLYLDSTLVKGLFTREDAQLVTAIGTHITIAVESARAQRIESERKEFARDLELTAAVQSFFFPRTRDLALHNTSVAAYNRSASQCSGDWWWYENDGTNLLLLIGDVTGHGAASAMVTASIATAYQALRREHPDDSPRHLLQRINDLVTDVIGGEYLMTISLLAMNTITRDYRILYAGSPPTFILRPNGTVGVDAAPSAPLGSARMELYESKANLPPNHMLVFASDGITEMPLATGRRMNARQFTKVIAAQRNVVPRTMLENTMAELDRLRGDKAQDDDITLVIVG